MKILVDKLPEKCRECYFIDSHVEHTHWGFERVVMTCNLTKRYLGDEMSDPDRMDDCPLKEENT